MQEQMTLAFDQITQPESVPKGATIQERFEAFHKANPQVYRALVQLALSMKNSGRKKYGMKGLFEVLRWNYNITTRGEEFKMSNDFTSRYARLIMDVEPELDGFFDTRPLRAIQN